MTEAQFDESVRAEIRRRVAEGERGACHDAEVPAPNAAEVAAAAEVDARQPTPGPWHVDTWRGTVGEFDGVHDAVWANDSLLICPTGLSGTPQSAANARLIAAAPEMLDALYEALDFAEDRQDVEDGSYGAPEANAHMQLATMLRAVILKTGAL